jgi:hypothetical protein
MQKWQNASIVEKKPLKMTQSSAFPAEHLSAQNAVKPSCVPVVKNCGKQKKT